MSAGAAVSTRKASGWIALLILFGITSTVEAFSVSHVFRFLPLYLGTVHVPPPEVPAWTGYLNAAFFLFGLPLVPFWGVWAERYGRIPIIARSAFVEMLGFALGPTFGGWLVDHGLLNLHTLFALDAVLSLAAGVMLLAFAREGSRPPG